MIERHYDEEALISLLESRREVTDTHLPSCPPCSGTLESFRTISGALRDADVWDKREIRTEAVPATIATLRAFADRMADEDTRAEAILTELLAGPRETWMPRLQEHPEWRMAGVARKLIGSATRAIDTMPPDAVELTALATEVADHLDQTQFPSDTIPRLRGAAWRERAYALYYTGDFPTAEAAIFTSERHFSCCSVSDYDMARTGIVRALVLRAFERFDRAMDAASESAETFARYQDVERTASARLAEVHMLFSRGDYRSAERLLRRLDQQLATTSCADTHARVMTNLGYCVRKTGRVDEAISYYETASAMFELLGVSTEAVRVRWNIASALAEAGRLADAYARMSAVTPELEQLGMTSEAALISIDIAELLLTQQRYVEAEQICRQAMAIFERSGTSYTSRALTAVAFIGEAVAQRNVTHGLVKNVREYIRRLPAEPNLLFAPSPPT